MLLKKNNSAPERKPESDPASNPSPAPVQEEQKPVDAAEVPAADGEEKKPEENPFPGIEHIDLSSYRFSQEILELVPEHIAKNNLIIPLEMRDNKLLVVMANPRDFDIINNMGVYTGKRLITAYASEEEITEAIQRVYTTQRAYDAAKELLGEDKKDSAGSEDDSQPIIRFVNNMFEQAIILKASDIHIEPEEERLRIRFRVDGHLMNYMETSAALSPSVISRIKFIAGMNIAERRVPQDGRITYHGVSTDIDLRISTLPSIFGEKIVIRITTALTFRLSKHSIGFTPKNLEKFDEILKLNHGIVLLTGPTGSGKTTTLYAALSEINKEDVNILTVEDPVEMIMPGITQVEINHKAGLDFAASLRAILRQDPNIVMVGEIRDRETAQIAMSLSITGHLVLSTLHTYDAPSSILRLVDMGVEPYMVSASVSAVIAQRLVRKICPHCRRAFQAELNQKMLLGLDPDKEYTLYRGEGCDKCNNVGYMGRLAVHEIMFMTAAVRDALARGASQSEIKKIAMEEGMESIQDNLTELVLNGTTTIEEMYEAYSSDI